MATPAQYQGTGKRKTSVARVILRPGDGSTWVNGRTIEEYFPRVAQRTLALAPRAVVRLTGTLFVKAGVTLTISCDAHSIGDLASMRYGVATAQRLGPRTTIDTVAAAGLRGRGGGGFPTAVAASGCRSFGLPAPKRPSPGSSPSCCAARPRSAG